MADVPNGTPSSRQLQDGGLSDAERRQRTTAGKASGRARRERVRDRDRRMARLRIRDVGMYSFSALAEEHGLTPEGARKAVRRALTDDPELARRMARAEACLPEARIEYRRWLERFRLRSVADNLSTMSQLGTN